jgi:uncharacterized protein YneF (UPF0154 family)
VVEVQTLFWSIQMPRALLMVLVLVLVIGLIIGWFLHSYFKDEPTEL